MYAKWVLCKNFWTWLANGSIAGYLKDPRIGEAKAVSRDIKDAVRTENVLFWLAILPKYYQKEQQGTAKVSIVTDIVICK